MLDIDDIDADYEDADENDEDDFDENYREEEEDFARTLDNMFDSVDDEDVDEQ